MDEADLPVAAVAAAGAAVRALMRSDAQGEAGVVEAVAATAIRLAERFCGQNWVSGADGGWERVPDPVRHGIAMLGQHLFEDRGRAGVPPAAVAALWRPYRALRLRS